MCYLLFSVVNLINCILHLIFKTVMTVMSMIELIVKTILQMIFNILLLILQVCSVLPVCCAFIITSKLRCFMCRRGPDCSILRGGLSELIVSILLLLLILFVMKVTGLLDTLLNSFGYVKKTKTLLRSVPEVVSNSPISFSQVQYVTDYDADEQIKDVTPSDNDSIKNLKNVVPDFRTLFKPEQDYSSTDGSTISWKVPFNFDILR